MMNIKRTVSTSFIFIFILIVLSCKSINYNTVLEIKPKLQTQKCDYKQTTYIAEVVDGNPVRNELMFGFKKFWINKNTMILDSFGKKGATSRTITKIYPNEIVEEFYQNDSLMHRSITKYHKNGLLKERLTYDSLGTLISSKKNFINGRRSFISELVWQNIKSRELITIDRNFNILTISTMYENDETNISYSNTYKNNRLKESIRYFGHNKQNREIKKNFIYNSKNDLIYSETYRNTSETDSLKLIKSERIEYSYDKKGRIISKIFYDKDKPISITDFEYY